MSLHTIQGDGRGAALRRGRRPFTPAVLPGYHWPPPCQLPWTRMPALYRGASAGAAPPDPTSAAGGLPSRARLAGRSAGAPSPAAAAAAAAVVVVVAAAASGRARPPLAAARARGAAWAAAAAAAAGAAGARGLVGRVPASGTRLAGSRASGVPLRA